MDLIVTGSNIIGTLPVAKKGNKADLHTVYFVNIWQARSCSLFVLQVYSVGCFCRAQPSSVGHMLVSYEKLAVKTIPGISKKTSLPNHLPLSPPLPAPPPRPLSHIHTHRHTFGEGHNTCRPYSRSFIKLYFVLQLHYCVLFWMQIHMRRMPKWPS